MKYNHGLAEKKFNIEWNKQATEYREAGMSEEMILQMYEYERSVFNSERRYMEHYEEAEFLWEETTDNSNEEAQKAKMREKYIDVISVSMEESVQHGHAEWLEEIENEEMFAALSSIKKEDLELLTLFAMEGYTVGEIAKLKGVSHQTIGKKINRMKKFLKNFK